jgi:hypothetical protein
MSVIRRTVRRSQTVVPFGPGSIYDFGNESLVALDISRWPANNCKEIRLTRLEERLGVNGFKEPPSAEGFGNAQRHFSVPYMRFPTWLFCPNCTRMFRWSWNDEKPGEVPKCRHCGPYAKLVPMRFIAVCTDGHLQEVPWGRWAHSANNGKKACKFEDHDLSFVSDSTKGGGLQSLSVVCNHCEAKRSLHQICSPNILKGVGQGKCSGRHPWQKSEDAEPCVQTPRVVQRGESNAYFADTLSALDISDSDDSGEGALAAKIKIHAFYPALQQLIARMPDAKPSDVAIDTFLKQVADGVQCEKSEVWECLRKPENDTVHQGDKVAVGNTLERLKAEEWVAFQRATKEISGRSFVTQRIDLDRFGGDLQEAEVEIWKQFRNLIKDVILARRIRIVRALTGFRRLDPGGRKVPPELSGNLRWLPATEIFGEGIFVELDHNALDSWCQKTPESAIDSIVTKQKQSGLGASLPPATLRRVLLHTFSHLLIRQLTFECGYSSSSLAERIYCNDDMAGVLIYTGSADSEGSLGGLVREGEADRIYSIIKTALFRGQWCSNDPICSEMPYQGIGGMNRAACHACTLLAETSCESANALLDRGLVFGSPRAKGYFQEFLKAMDGAK